MLLPSFARVLRERTALALIGCLAAVPLAGCASSPGGGAAAASGDSRPQSSRYVVTQADLERVRADNLYDALSKIRPEFLKGRTDQTGFIAQPSYGGSSASTSGTAGSAIASAPPEVIAYKDNVRLTSVDDLRQIMISMVKEVRFMPSAEAVTKLGANHAGGAILITSK